MHLINVETLKLEEFSGKGVPPYAILSHTWGAVEDEVSFRDIQGENIKEDKRGYFKLEGCCRHAKEDKLKYAWIDTCCINKDSSTELDEAIRSMFRWYREASRCYVYLSDVPTGDKPRDPSSKFRSSRWFRRGWTLQELLAPKHLCFYDQTWTSLEQKTKLAGVIEGITCIPSPFIRGVPLDNASVAQRLSWAANRATKKEEDMAYCLLGIFGVSMPMMYGEGDQAFRRLQQEIMKQTGDHSILAWHLNRDGSIPSQSTDVRSGGALATAPSYFVNCGDIVSTKKDKNTFHISAGYLQARLPLYKTSAGDMYGLLSCGPEANAEQVVGIPLTSSSDEYIRPQGHRSVLLPKTTSNISPTLVSIQLKRTSAEVNQQNWFYVEDSVEDLELIDVYPGDRWQKEIGMIATANDSDGNITQWSLARFSTKGEKSQDVIVLLEFEDTEDSHKLDTMS